MIARKREGEALEPAQLRAFLRGYLADEVSDAQMSALLMAIHFRGLGGAELATLVDAMVSSGRTLDLSHLPGPVVDKHSTGGVGDKVSLALVPLAAELGLYVPMMAGRGLGHTGGTLDKLEAIPGFRTDLGLDAFRAIVEEVGAAVMGQSEEIAPLDRRLYALRDVTGTVSSIALIAASIMSKKLAEGLSGLVLDVKLGAGAFIPEPDRARELARTMVAIGADRGLETRALLTAMDRPLGRAVGNALEVEEALACLRGEGPPDLTEVVASLVGEMLALGGLSGTPEEGRERALDALEGGRGVARMARLVERQGGDPRVVEDPGLLPRAPEIREVRAEEAGSVGAIDPVELGYAAVGLGGGRARIGQEIDPRVGFVLAVGVGDRLESGDLLGTVHAASSEDAERGRAALSGAVAVGRSSGPESLPLVGERIPGP
ncbi:MAG TPA: thymidine phosphorylase [Longimicrobiales bacterium]|nr:thymidine phosphorylase [Longimicrobiales bacterium]